MEIDHEAAEACQDRLTLAIGMAFPDNPNVDELAGAMSLFLDHAINIVCDLSRAEITNERGKEIRKNTYRFIMEQVTRHAANSN